MVRCLPLALVAVLASGCFDVVEEPWVADGASWNDSQELSVAVDAEEGILGKSVVASQWLVGVSTSTEADRVAAKKLLNMLEKIRREQPLKTARELAVLDRAAHEIAWYLVKAEQVGPACQLANERRSHPETDCGKTKVLDGVCRNDDGYAVDALCCASLEI